MRARLHLAITLLAYGCSDPTHTECVVGELPESSGCGDGGTDCIVLADLVQGCMGSHTEQDCTVGRDTFIRVPESDVTNLFFHQDGTLAAVQNLDEGSGDCADDWYGLDLSTCERIGEPEQVNCEGYRGEGG